MYRRCRTRPARPTSIPAARRRRRHAAIGRTAARRGCGDRWRLHRALHRAASGARPASRSPCWRRRTSAGAHRARLRPGGAVSEAGSRGDPAPLRAGARSARRRCGRRRPALVFELIDTHGIDCWPVRSGLIFAAHSPAGRRDLEKPHRVLAAARRAGRDGWRAQRCADADRLAALPGGVAGPARRPHQSVRLCARPRASPPSPPAQRSHTATRRSATVRRDGTPGSLDAGRRRADARTPW